MAASKGRDYAAEYARRVARAVAAGKSRQAARGHARGEGKAVRKRPTSRAEREAAQARGATLRDHAAALKRGKEGKERGIPGAAPFRSSLADRRNWRKPGDIIFTFRGKPLIISPKFEEQDGPEGLVYQSVPVRFTKLDAPRAHVGPWPPTVGDVLADFSRWVEYAASKTDLEDPELVDVYVVTKSLG